VSELIYDKTFEEALEAVNQGHRCRHIFSGGEQKTLDDMLRLVEKIKPYFLRDGWAIIERKTDKELLVEHFKKEDATPVAIIIKYNDGENTVRIVHSLHDGKVYYSNGFDFLYSVERLATKKEALSLVLERDE
jgi:hypothetical protein